MSVCEQDKDHGRKCPMVLLHGKAVEVRPTG